MQYYRDLSSWLTYKAILASEFNLAVDLEPAEKWERVFGHDVHIDEWPAFGDSGPGTAERVRLGTVIFVHGGGGNGRILAPFAQRAAEFGWCVLAPDLPGFGLTRPA